jgi:hypothetical protein
MTNEVRFMRGSHSESRRDGQLNCWCQLEQRLSEKPTFINMIDNAVQMDVVNRTLVSRALKIAWCQTVGKSISFLRAGSS